MSLPEIVSQPKMFMQQFVGGKAFEQLQCSTDTHGCRHLNEQMDMVNGNMQFIDFKSMSFSNFSDESFAVNSDSIKFHRVFSILRLPNKMESILPESMLCTSQIHFLPPSKPTRNQAPANFENLLARGSLSEPLHIDILTELNIGGGNSSLGFKAEVSLPHM